MLKFFLAYALAFGHPPRLLRVLIVPGVPMSRGVTGVVYLLMLTGYPLLPLRLVDWLTKKLTIAK